MLPLQLSWTLNLQFQHLPKPISLTIQVEFRCQALIPIRLTHAQAQQTFLEHSAYTPTAPLGKQVSWSRGFALSHLLGVNSIQQRTRLAWGMNRHWLKSQRTGTPLWSNNCARTWQSNRCVEREMLWHRRCNTQRKIYKHECKQVKTYVSPSAYTSTSSATLASISEQSSATSANIESGI